MNFYIFLFLIFLQGQLLFAGGQSVIKFPKKQKINIVKESQKYIAVSTTDMQNKTHGVTVFDRDGKAVYKISGIQNYIKDAQTIPATNTLIYIVSGKLLEWEEMEKDKIVSVDLTNGAVNWETLAGGDSYEMDGNKRFLITNSLTEISGEKSHFEIINLKDGSIFRQRSIAHEFYAVWYDDQHVLFAIQSHKKVLNPHYSELQALKEGRNRMRQERLNQWLQFRNGVIPKEKYKIKNDSLTTAINANAKKIKRKFSSTGRRKVSIQKFIHKSMPAQLRIYNIETDTFDREMSFDGFVFGALDLPFVVSVDRKKNIYVLVDRKKNTDVFNTFLLKLNRNFQREWQYHFNLPYLFTKVKYNGLLYFAHKTSEGFTLITPEREVIPESRVFDAGFLPAYIRNTIPAFMGEQYQYVPFGLSISLEKNEIKILKKEGI